MKQVLLYLPVLHAGYQALLDRHADAGEVLLLGEGFRAEYPALAKDIRALPAASAAAHARLAAPGRVVRVIEPGDLPGAISASTLVLPDEEIMRDLVARHDLGNGRQVVFDKTFLRWDREWSRSERPAHFSGSIAAGDLPRGLMAAAQQVSARSSDWWRQVGAIAVRGQEVIGYAWNRHHPTEYSPYIDGDPRNEFSRGVRADLSTAIHAEAAVIAQAARDGVPVRGADLYVTTFPCPACARLIAEAQFRRCYVAGSYSVLEGENILQAAGVDVFWVDFGEAEPGLTEARSEPGAS